ncbi:MAG: phosphatidylserine/phosphatidylglycerophosphate/cardiolipin synthase family protein, partial [Myxococcaceae bacterium]|nr:phosphatidylserine/phosphatidylglycerophosphate/cardiolipin synthase family protein [Myxococcaceae bacterium]
MRDDDGSVPLLDGLKNLERQFESALITTYNCYFPFFEEVILRRLSSRGCRHVMLCCDARMLAGALNEPELRPHWAGATYWLAPVSAPSSFHPKVMLFGGRKSARVVVGSHNATYSGFGGNDEVTNVVNVSGAKDRDGAAVLLSALDFVEAWLGSQPDAFRAQLRRFRELTSWAAGPVNADRPIQFVGSLPEGASLWEKVRPLLPTDATRVTVVGPYFDSQLEFLARLQTELGVEVCVGVQPEQALLDPQLAHTLGGVRFVEATRSTDDDGVGKFLHAKALLVEGRSGATLISGSANPSFAAWLAPPERRNAEAVLVRRDREILDLPFVRWLQSLQAATALVPADWARFEKPRPDQEGADVRNADHDSAVPLPLFEGKDG